MQVLTLAVFFVCLRCLKSDAQYFVWWYKRDGNLEETEFAQLGPINPSSIPKTAKELSMEDIPAMQVISGLKKLTKIDIRNSTVIFRSDSLVDLPSLDFINLANNQKLYLQTACFVNLNVTYMLIFRNSIPRLEDGVFLSMPRLEKVSLHENELKEWNPSAFLQTPKMTTLLLNGNELKHIQAEAFRNLKSLKHLFLASNYIEDLHEDAFRGLDVLEVLHLSNNRIRTLQENIFAPYPIAIVEGTTVYKKRGLKSLYLHRNHLSFLPTKILEDLSQIKQINIQLNPWKCGCYFKIMEWGRLNSLKVNSIPMNGPVCISIKVASKDVCAEEVDCGAIKRFYTSYPTNMKYSLLQEGSRSMQKQRKDAIYNNLKTFCNLSLEEEPGMPFYKKETKRI